MNKQPPSDKSSTRYRVILLVDDHNTFEKRLSAESEDEAVRRAVRWVTTQMGTFREGQNIKIVIVRIELLGEAVSIRTFKTRPLGVNESLRETDRIRIPKGTKYRSAHPQTPGLLTAKRSYITATGCKTTQDEQDVCWRGNGGYTCWTDKTSVEKVIG